MAGRIKPFPAVRQDHSVGPAAVRQFPAPAATVSDVPGIDVMLQPEALSYFKPLGIQIGSYYSRTAPVWPMHGQNDTNRPLPDHQHRFIRLQLQCFNALHAGVYWLDE